MSADELDAPGRHGWYARVAEVVGDLGNPFYLEERQRDVWNEASAVGFQLALWLGTAAATAMVWLGGEQSLPYAVTTLVVVGLPALVSLVHVAQLGVHVADHRQVLRLRLAPYAVLVALFVVGTARVAPEGGFARGFAQGTAIGSVLAAAWLVVTGLRARRRAGG